MFTRVAAFAATLAMACAPAIAGDADIGQWFKSLKQPATGASCCDIADCHAVEAEEQPDGRWKARIYDEWVPIPQSVVLGERSRIGAAVACTSPPLYYPGTSGPSFSIFCFAPPALSM